MHVMLDPKSNVPIYEQIIRQVRERLAQGIVKPGEKVPSIRELSAELMVNPNTVSKAYKELERTGIFVTFRGKGTFISEDVPTGVSSEEMDKVKEKTKNLVLDSIYAGIQLEELKGWLEQFYQELGGRKDDRS